MRLVSKLTLVLMLAAAVVLTIQAAFNVNRLLSLHEQETRDDLSRLGTALGSAVSELWRVAGEPHARAHVRRADSRRAPVAVRPVTRSWIRISAPMCRFTPRIVAGEPHPRASLHTTSSSGSRQIRRDGSTTT